MFWVSLVKIKKRGDEKAFAVNFIHVHKDVYIFEGDVDFVSEDDGVELDVLTEGAVDSLGGLSKKELIAVCKDYLGYDPTNEERTKR